MSGREAFEAAMRATGYTGNHYYVHSAAAGIRYGHEIMQAAFTGWSARDAEVAAKDARIAELEAALYCENSPYEAKTHRCVHCDEEVPRDE